MATINVSKSGTLNPTLSRIDNDDLSTTAYVAGDILNIASNAQLKIDTSTAASRPGTIQAISGTAGTILVENTSTTTPIVVSLTAETSNIAAYYSSVFRVRGQWITVATGDGTTGQTIDFNTTGPMGVAIDLPVCVWVETGDTRHRYLSGNGLATPGYFKPFFNCYQTTDSLALNILTSFYGDIDHGNVFQFNRSTLVATFGNGGAVGTSNGGAVIPNGARVLFPNIHFTSTTLAAAVSNRNEILCGNQGSVDIEIASFSPNWVFGRGATNGFFGCGNATLTDVSVAYGVLLQANVGTIRTTGLSVGMTYTEVNTTSIQYAGNVGPTYINDNFVCAKYVAGGTFGFRINGTAAVREWGATHVNYLNTAASADRNPIYVDYLAPSTDEQLMVGPLYPIGGRSLFIYSSNLHVTEHQSSDRPSAVADTSLVNSALYLSSTVHFSIGKIRKMTNGVGCRSALIAYDGAPVLCGISDVIYDGNSNTDNIIAAAGTRVYIANASCNNMRTRLFQGAQSGSKKIRYANMTTNATTAIGPYITPGSYTEWGVGTTGSWTGIYGADNNAFQLFWTNTSKTAGAIRIGPMVQDNLEDSFTLVSGTEGTDWSFSKNGALFLEKNGVELIWNSKYPLRGITDFSGGTWSASGGNQTYNIVYEFAMKNPTDQTWGSWFVGSTSANWNTALSALTGYDSDIGFDLKFRITTTADATVANNRWFAFAGMTCTPDSAFVPPEVGYIPMAFSNAVAGSTVRLMDNTVPATPVTIQTTNVAGTSDEWDFPYNFDGLAKAYRWKLRKAGYAEFNASGSTYIKGRTNGVLQVQNVVVDEVAASAITGISVSGSTNTVTISGTVSEDELYAYCQWWAMQVENMDYEIPLTTTDSVSYSSTYNFVNNGALTGSVNITTNGTYSGSGTYDSNTITASNGTFTNITVSGLVANSYVRINNETDNIGLYSAEVAGASVSIPVTWTSDKIISVRVLNCHGLVAYYPVPLVGTLTSSGASFTVSQTIDPYYTIDGSTIPYFATDYPLLQVDIYAGTSVTPQEMYCWVRYQEHSAQGSIYYFNGISTTDGFNFRIDVNVIDLKVDNTSGHNVDMVGGYIYRSDGTSWIYELTANSIIPIYDRAYVASGGGGGATPAEIWSYSDRTITGGGGGGGGGFSSQAIQNSIANAKRDIIEKIDEIPKISLEKVETQLNENQSQIDIAKTEIINTIKASETEICSDVIRKTKELKEDNVKTRNLVRQKSEKIDKNVSKLADRQDQTDQMIEDEADEIESDIERIINEEADTIEKEKEDQINKEADQIESELNQSTNGND